MKEVLDLDQGIRLVDAIAGMLAVLVWPALMLFVVLRFRLSIAGFLSDLSEFTLKAGGVEATARRREVEAAASFGAASTKPSGQSPEQVADPSQIADALTDALPNARARRRLEGSRVLWVDDSPENNQYERQAFEALGIRFTLSTSTEDALERLSNQDFDAIISDMGRPPDPRAGYSLLDKLRELGDHTPFVIYASSRALEHVREAREHGAVGCTNSSQELISLVSHALGIQPRR